MPPRTTTNLAILVLALLMAPSTVQAEDPPAKPDENATEPDWQTKFHAVYRLSDGQNARLIQPPFIPERQTYHAQNHSQIAQIAGQYGFRWKKKGGKVEQRYWSTDPGTVASALHMADVDVADLDGVRDVFDIKVPGDWIVRAGAPRDAILADIQRELTKATDGRIRVEPARVEKDVIVARGKYAFKPLPSAPREPNSIHLFTDTMDTEQGAGGGTASMDGFLRRVGELADMKVVNEIEPHKGDVEWTNNRSDDAAAKSAEKREQLLKNITDQTSLEFRIERRPVDVWRVTDTTDKSGGL